ncbi:MAG: class I SAM-dependent methyltransferase [Lachnospiraceae bacterium]
MTGLIYQKLCELWQWIARKNDHLFRGDADFSGWVSQEKAGFTEQRGNKYQPSTDAVVRVLKRFPISEQDAVIDIGCGKGKAMYLMSRFPFGKIRGYDLSEQLVNIANQNFRKLHLGRCEAIQADAATFRYYDGFNYFYIYNSFPQEIFEVMIGHVLESIRRKPRKCRFIYLHPVCHDYVVNHTPFHLVYRRKSVISWFDCCCYEYEA